MPPCVFLTYTKYIHKIKHIFYQNGIDFITSESKHILNSLFARLSKGVAVMITFMYEQLFAKGTLLLEIF